MRDGWIRLFHRLPSSVRARAAGLRGRYLASWRYGPDTDRLVAEALARDRWSAARWQPYVEERLARVLHRAATTVPYYEAYWRERRRRGDRASFERLENWPILEKEPLRANPGAFVARDCNIKRMFREHTSGTSGTSIDLWWSRETVRAWYALFEARWRRWYGVTRNMPWAILGGQLVKPVTERRPPFWIVNPALNQLYLSSYHLAPDLMPSYLDALRTFRPEYLYGYTSALHTLALETIRLGCRDLGMKVVITNAEPLFEHQRRVIAEAFHCPVRETYGMAEIVTAASECQSGVLHLWPEVGYVEVLNPAGEPAANDVSGDLVCTGLLNQDMPLIRYRTGDRGAKGAPESCQCGRQLPALSRVDGRSDDILYTMDGRAVGRLDPVFKGSLPIREAQIIQERLDRIRVRFVPAPDFVASSLESVKDRLRARLGPVEVILESTTAIARTSRGKFRAVISHLPLEERASLDRLAAPVSAK